MAGAGTDSALTGAAAAAGVASTIAGAGAGPQSDVTHMASSTDGRTWTELGLVGAGSVPGLVKDRSGTLRIYVVGF